jgi:hypothetical protein
MSWPKLLAALALALLLTPPGPAAPKKKVLLVGQGPDGHPKTTHEYMAGVRVLAKCLAGVPDLELTVVRADGTWQEGPDLLGRADAVVLFVSEGARWIDTDARRRTAFARLAARRAGIVALHWALGTRDAKPVPGFLKLLGGCHGGPDRKYRVLETDVRVADPDHPIAAGIGRFRVRDEFYYRLKFVRAKSQVRPILRATIDGRQETVAWAWERPDGGRSFGFSGLHFHANWRLRPYRRLVAQAVLWTLKMPVPKKGLAVDLPYADFKLGQQGRP